MKHRLIFTTATRPELKLRANSASPLEVDSNPVSVVFRRLGLRRVEPVETLKSGCMKYRWFFITTILFLCVLGASATLA